MAHNSPAPGHINSDDQAALTLFPPDLVLDYSIRESSRAKTVRLNMTPERGLVVVIPRGYSRKRIPEIIESKQRWIEKARRWALEQRRQLESKPPLAIPAVIELQAIGESLRPDQPHRIKPDSRPCAPGRALDNIRPDGRSAGLLCRPEPLDRSKGPRPTCALAQELRAGNRPRNTEGQLSAISAPAGPAAPQWTISLNQKLLFLPPQARALCPDPRILSSAHMNHSRHFWSRVARHEPDGAIIGASWASPGSWFRHGWTAEFRYSCRNQPLISLIRKTNK